ncbi:MAG: MFS transporter [Gammaproteobacteria bacterium]|nr:MFS transporter [Gammaproteobacteria bacterium]
MTTLIESRAWRFAALAILYSAQGLPFGLFTVAIPSWMASTNYSATQIGSFIAITSLPWSLKLFVAPLMDRFTYLPMGFRRPWIIGAQFLLLVSFATLGVIPNELFWLTALGCACNTCAATQDVAVDGMAIDILPESDRARANGFMFGGQFLGISIGASGGGYALQYFGLGGLAWLCATFMFLVLLIPLCLGERPGEKRFPWSQGVASIRSGGSDNTWHLIRTTLKILLLPASLILLFVQVSARLSEGIIMAMLPVYTVQQLGLANTTFNDFSAVGGLASAVIGVLISPWFDRLGSHNAYWYAWGFFLLALIAMPLTINQWTMATIVVNWVSSHLLMICLIATMMRFCDPRVAATQFAIYMAMSNLNFAGGAWIYASLANQYTTAQIIWLAAAVASSSLPFWYWLNRRYIRLR